MGRLAEIAGTKALTGPVSFTDARGVTHQCQDEAAAEAVTSGKAVFHHRGAFYEQGCAVRGYTAPGSESEKPAEAPPPAPPAPPKVTKKKTRRRTSSDSE